jgi:DNA-binding Lrp family transcriptional regulator
VGYDVIAFIGIYLEKSSLYDSVAKELKKIPEIVRLNYTTGNYSMFAEIVCRDMDHLKKVLHDQLQQIRGIERTETLFLSKKVLAGGRKYYSFYILAENCNFKLQLVDGYY